MGDSPGDDRPRKTRLADVFGEFQRRLKEAEAAERQRLLAEHPDLEADLRAYFASMDSGEATNRDLPETIALDPNRTPGVHAAPTLADRAGSDEEAIESASSSPDGSRRFGDYELLEEIARGGMGVVYRARQVSLNRIVAVKMILSGQLASEMEVQRFRTEAEAAATLQHPGIVAIHEVGKHEGQHYFSMDFVEGISLADRIREQRPSPREAAQLLLRIAQAVDFAHQRGIVHRDLKPSNILIDAMDEPRVTDFGLATRMEGGSDLTATGVLLGTPSYMSPEMADGQPAGPASDIYSLGAILYEMLTGQPPFRADNPIDTLSQVREAEPSAPRSLVRSIPRDLETICLTCLHKEPEKRYASAGALTEDLQRYLDGEHILARPLGIIGRLFRWSRREPALATTLMALFVFYLQHLICLYVLHVPGEGGVFHWVVTALVGTWALTAWLFQWLCRHPRWRTAGTFGWAAMDVVFFTGFLLIGDGPKSSLLPGYLLLMGGAALRSRALLMWFITGLCMASYLGIFLDARWHRPEFTVSSYVALFFLISVTVMGIMLHFLLRRVRPETQGG